MLTASAAMEFLVDPTDPPSKREIAAAALRLFAQRGLHATNIRAIAEAAGYTNPALFKFFPTKRALALHLFERCYLELSHALAEAYAPQRPFVENLRAVLGAQHAFVERYPDAYFFLQDHARELWPRCAQAVRRASTARLLRSLLEDGVREGAVDPEADLELVVAAMMGAFQQFARARYLGGLRGDSAGRLAELETLLRRMIAPGPHEGGGRRSLSRSRKGAA